MKQRGWTRDEKVFVRIKYHLGNIDFAFSLSVYALILSLVLRRQTMVLNKQQCGIDNGTAPTWYFVT